MKLIEKAVSENWIRQLAFYHLLKFMYNNSCIYDYKSRMDEVAKSLNICPKTLYSYLNFLRSKDLIFDHANNLMLKSIKDFKTRKKTVIFIEESNSLFDITCLLYAKLIEMKAKKQAFAESVRRFGTGDRFKDRPGEIPFRPSFSCRTIAKLLNVSQMTARKVTINLVRLNVIEIEKQKPQLMSDNFTDLNSIEDYPGYRYNDGFKLFEIFGDRINFLQFPVILKKISLKQIKALKSYICL